MTEQPKFQRRKRRGAAEPVSTPSARPERVTPQTVDPSIEEIDALIAKKEALLQRKAAFEAERRLRKAEQVAEQARQADLARMAELDGVVAKV